MLAKVRTIIFYICWFAFSLAWFPIALLLITLPLKNRISVISKSYSYCLLWLARLICGIRWQLIYENPTAALDTRNFVVLSKHQSTWETFFLVQLFSPIVPVVKKELSYLPFFGWILNTLKPIYIDRSKKTNALKQVLALGAERLKQGISILIFPEGTRVKPGLRKEFSRSAALLAVRNQKPIIAVAHNSADCWPNHSWVKHPGTIYVWVSETYSTDGTNASELTEQVENWINQKVDEISATPFIGEYSSADSSGKRF